MPEEINLKNYIGDIILEMKAMALNEQELIQEHVGNEIVLIDKKLLKNILFNLISNAIKFSPDGGQIKISSRVLNSSIKESIEDQYMNVKRTKENCKK